MSSLESNELPVKIGILGFGHLGQYLYEHLRQENNQQFELIFLWNRTRDAFNRYSQQINPSLIVDTIEEGLLRSPDLVVEVAHPDIVEKYADKILDVANLFIGSPTALAKCDVEMSLRKKTTESKHSVYIGCGAFWGSEDIVKMNEQNTLRGLKVTMKKHPDSFRLNEPLQSQLKSQVNGQTGEIIIYSGPVRDLCPLAPNNVNTMAIGAIIASNLGFDGVQGCLIADTALTDRHVVEIEVIGPTTIIPNEEPINFYVKTTRCNPAVIGVVTGKGTYLSFLSSVYRAKNKKPGIHVI